MNYPDDWQQFSRRYQVEVLWSYWDIYKAWPEWQTRSDFENMLLMGGEIAR